MTAGNDPPVRFDDLVRHIEGRLANAAGDPAAPWRTPMLATVAAGGAPRVRTVVLREADPGSRMLRINTDRRTAKIGEIAAEPRVELGFWDPDAREQLRVAGQASVVTARAELDAVWAALTPAGRAIYGNTVAPGTPVPGPHGHLKFESATASAALALLRIVWDEWDWVWLGENEHRRARIRWDADGRRQDQWVEP